MSFGASTFHQPLSRLPSPFHHHATNHSRQHIPTPPLPGDTPRLVLRLRAEPCPLRCVAWQPDLQAAFTDDEGQPSFDQTPPGAVQTPGQPNARAATRRCFLTASQLGDLKIWDPEDPFAPLHSRSFNVAAATSCVWVTDPGAIVVTLADGGVRVVFTSLAGLAGVMRSQYKLSAMYLEGKGGGSGG